MSAATPDRLETQDYRIAIGGDGPLAYTWSDKPHRLVYDLAKEVDSLRDQVAAVEEVCDRMVLDWHYTGEPTGPHLATAAAMVRSALDSSVAR